MAWLNNGIKIQTDIFALLPEAHQDADLERARQYVSQRLNDKVFVVLDAENDRRLEQAAQAAQTQADQSRLFQPLRPQLAAKNSRRLYTGIKPGCCRQMTAPCLS